MLSKFNLQFDRVHTAELLVLLSVLLTWLDFIPRVIALWNYPQEYFEAVRVAALWPAEIASKAGAVLFIITGVSLFLNWLYPRWMLIISAISFTQLAAIYWSYFTYVSHGSQLMLLCLWSLVIFRLSKRRHFDIWLLSIQVLVGLMFASAAYFKWTTSGFYWTDGFEMQRRIFASYSLDGRWIPPWTKILVHSKSLAHYAGVGELLCQTLCFPSFLLSLRWPRFRFLACFSGLFAAAGIHLGMTLFLYQFIPLCFVLLVRPKAPDVRWQIKPFAIALLIIPIASARLAFATNGALTRNAFPFAYYPMYSDSGYPIEVERLRAPTIDHLDLVQREFFILFGSMAMDDKLEKIAQAHRLDPEEMTLVPYDFANFQREPIGFKPSGRPKPAKALPDS